MAGNILEFPTPNDRQGGSLPRAVEEYRQQIGKEFGFSFPISADGVNAGNGELVANLSFSCGRLVQVLAPGERFAVKVKHRQDGPQGVILGCPTGTAVFVGSYGGIFYNFGVDLADNGVKLIPRAG